MALNLKGKQAIVEEVAKVAQSALSAVAAEYSGLTVTEMDKLRVLAREKKVYLRVIRNTLACRAVENTDFACLQQALVGPLILAFSQDAPGAAARLLRDFAKNNPKLLVKALAIQGQLLTAQQLDAVANLPTYEEALASIMAVMKAPITKLVRTLVEPHAKLVRTLAAIRDLKQAA